MNYPERDLHGPNQAQAITDLIKSLFLLELIKPSEITWLHFAWLSDIEILDNTSRKYAWCNPSWPSRKITLTEILDVILSKGGSVRLVIRRDKHNEYILRRLKKLKEDYSESVEWRVVDYFHDKGMVGDHYFLSGSMNLTKYGITVNTEHIYLRTNPSSISEQKLHLKGEWENYAH